MAAPSAIAAVRPCHSIELGMRKVHAARPAFSTAAENTYIIYEIRFIHAAKVNV